VKRPVTIWLAAWLVLRKPNGTDRAGIVEVLTDPEVRPYLGGPSRREDVERFLD
jgi:hypothetical protein